MKKKTRQLQQRHRILCLDTNFQFTCSAMKNLFIFQHHVVVVVVVVSSSFHLQASWCWRDEKVGIYDESWEFIFMNHLMCFCTEGRIGQSSKVSTVRWWHPRRWSRKTRERSEHHNLSLKSVCCFPIVIRQASRQVNVTPWMKQSRAKWEKWWWRRKTDEKAGSKLLARI